MRMRIFWHAGSSLQFCATFRNGVQVNSLASLTAYVSSTFANIDGVSISFSHYSHHHSSECLASLHGALRIGHPARYMILSDVCNLDLPQVHEAAYV